MKKISSNTVKWGIIGVGDVCEIKSAPAMNLVPNSRVEAVMRRNGEKARDYARRHGIAKWYDDADTLINDPEINAIYIATPPHVHAEYTIKAAAAGKPVYVEKPMAKTHQECEAMVAACATAGVPLYTAYYRRALPNFLKVKDIIDSGILGDIRMVEIRLHKPLEPDIITHQDFHWRTDPAIAGGGYFYDLGSHQLDLLDFFFGPVTSASGHIANQAGQYKAEDIVTATMVFESGVLGTGSWVFTTGESSDKEIICIMGSKGQVTFSTFGKPNILLETDEKGEEHFAFEFPKHIQQPLIELIVGDLLGTATCPSTGVSGARTNRVMEWICR
ncbi:MAG: Gfo/Idh/MocA family oxidoreductase [Cyclobacteriaceae bacterium]|nr:Gfo/Idh/MocA family oxidoreductase [Cyclobacteriaceae bacterium]